MHEHSSWCLDMMTGEPAPVSPRTAAIAEDLADLAANTSEGSGKDSTGVDSKDKSGEASNVAEGNGDPAEAPKEEEPKEEEPKEGGEARAGNVQKEAGAVAVGGKDADGDRDVPTPKKQVNLCRWTVRLAPLSAVRRAR